MPFSVLIDSSIWIASPLLNTPMGAALLFEISHRNGRLVLPEIVRREVEKHTVRLWDSATGSITNGYRDIATIMGSRDDFQIPDRAAVLARINERLAGLAHIIAPIPVTLDLFERALTRLMNEDLPNSPKNQQYKDSLIWECILDQAGSEPLHFLTADKAFYDAGTYARGLAAPLQSECEARGIRVIPYATIEAFLDATRSQQPPFDASQVVNAIRDTVLQQAAAIGLSKGVRLNGPLTHEIDAYVTEQLGRLAITFKFTYSASLMDPEGPTGPAGDRVTLSGSANYSVADGSASDILLSEFVFMQDGTTIIGSRSAVYRYGSASVAFGRATIQNRFQFPVPVQLPPVSPDSSF